MAILELGLDDGTHLELLWTFGENPEAEEAAHLAAALFKDHVVYKRLVSDPSVPDLPKNESLNIDAQVVVLIYTALERSLWVQKEAAGLLGITPRELSYKIRQYEIHPPPEVMRRWGWEK